MNDRDLVFDFELAHRFSERFLAVRGGGGTRRYHTLHTNKEDTVASHSWGVATIVDQLYDGKPPAHMLRAALYHDIAEHVYGDLPSPAKRALNSKDLRKLEDGYARDHELFVELTEGERLILKMADCLEGLCFCAEEMLRGNRTLIPVWNRYREYVDEKICDMGRLSSDVSETESEVLLRASARTGSFLGCIQARINGA